MSMGAASEFKNHLIEFSEHHSSLGKLKTSLLRAEVLEKSYLYLKKDLHMAIQRLKVRKMAY